MTTPLGEPLRPAAIGCALLLVAAVLLAGCSSRAPAAPSPTTGAASPGTTVPISTADPQAAARQAVLAAYRGFWTAYIAAADPMNPADPRLAAHATGRELAQVRRTFIAAKAAGVVFRGTIDLAPRVARVAGRSATVEDCYDSHLLAYDAASGVAKERDDPRRKRVTVSMALDGSAWKASATKFEGYGCAP